MKKKTLHEQLRETLDYKIIPQLLRYKKELSLENVEINNYFEFNNEDNVFKLRKTYIGGGIYRNESICLGKVYDFNKIEIDKQELLPICKISIIYIYTI